MSVIIYTVQPGDTISKIAEKYGVPINAIVRDNELTDANDLRVGQKLRISTADCNANNWYVVRRGDTLYDLARAFGTTVDDLTSLNEIANPNMIFPGQIIRIR